MRYHILLILFSSLWLVSCKTTKQNAPAAIEANAEVEQGPQLIFLNFKIEQDSIKNIEKAVLVNHIITAGKLKQDIAAERINVESNNLICSFFDADMQLLKQIILDHPLHKTVEAVSADGQLTTRTIHLSEAEFSIRTQLEINTVYITLEKILDNPENRTLLLKHNLKQK